MDAFSANGSAKEGRPSRIPSVGMGCATKKLKARTFSGNPLLSVTFSQPRLGSAGGLGSARVPKGGLVVVVVVVVVVLGYARLFGGLVVALEENWL